MYRYYDQVYQLCENLKSIHNQGAKLYNRGHHAEAFRLYQGALFVSLQVLSNRPDLKFIVADGLSDVEQSTANEQLKAFRLHEVIEHVRAVLKTPVEPVSAEMQS